MTMPLLLRQAARVAAAALACASVLAGCGGAGGGSGPVCPRLDGAWSVAMDDGSGRIVQQQWTLHQSGCDLAITGDPPDGPGPLLNTASGGVGERDLWARWINLAGACRYTSGLEATLSDDAAAFSGTLTWSRYASGSDFCPGGSGRLAVQGRR